MNGFRRLAQIYGFMFYFNWSAHAISLTFSTPLNSVFLIQVPGI